ncbi:GNAT family N-acetyltransferase [Streptomyces sp. AV19]|uniref:GNAT family N-acetyltransferase n=1 Tax=Streptomyces sp. AV19 TaxID=2793068 RepID=UPI0018FE7F42|nr:GNAT family N-acetyltransferase [Streptomyces sp. AV19]MBH1935648.1 GNAT family N-acetyltransferase [Streptomyces sp. AV19]MDG4536076.1 GNAT family N-acetyltransferase [Streptomyces sp. AV19]
MEFTTGGRLEIRINSGDVGKRVSIRALNDRTRSPERFTDTVGVLDSWENGVLCVTRRNGMTVRIAEDAVVAGKVVPMTPARRRGPAATVRELQETAARGWPAVETARLGGWTLRAAGGFTARANSALPLGDSGLPLPAALDRVTAWYAERGLPARVQVTTGDPDADRRLDDELAARGWTEERHALMRTAALAPIADVDAAVDVDAERVLLNREPDDAWLDAYGRTAESVKYEDAARAVLTGGPSVWFARVPGSAAIGRCVVDGRWAGFAALEVGPEHRRQGLATALMARLARQALDEGASAAYLQVERDNAGADALYGRLGFTTHHAYHYRREPGR